MGEGWGNADCLKSKAELPIKGGLAFLLGESVLISVRYLKLCEFFDIGKKYLDFECTIFLSFHLRICIFAILHVLSIYLESADSWFSGRVSAIMPEIVPPQQFVYRYI